MVSKSISSAIVFMVLLGVSSFTVSYKSRSGEQPFEVAEMPSSNFTVRVSAFPEENGGFASGAYYRFESRRRGAKDWVRAMEFRHDDPDPIPRENVRFMTPDAAFVFMGWKYAVTTDGGMHWQTWNAEKDLAGWAVLQLRSHQGN
jgi:hypothetical protein